MVTPRAAQPTVKFIDDSCKSYRDLFAEVRSFEAFKHLHVGLISEVKRKPLPVIAKVVGLSNSQSLQQFLCESPWSAQAFFQQQLILIPKVVAGRKVTLIIDETGDRRKGTSTDYMKRQYIGNLGKVENGIVGDNILIHSQTKNRATLYLGDDLWQTATYSLLLMLLKYHWKGLSFLQHFLRF
ncbi:transposase [Leptolyngbya sp. Heron Island J]|nr:transposase [Leptolyngbya sp. Heron Island J]